MSLLPSSAWGRHSAVADRLAVPGRHRGTHLTIQNAAFLLALCAFGALAWISLQTANRFAQLGEQAQSAHEARDELSQLTSRVDYSESARRGFAMTGDPRFLTNLENSRREAAQAISSLKLLVRDAPQKDKLADLLAKVDAVFAAIDRSVEQRRSRDLSAEEQRAAADAVRGLIEQGRFASHALQVIEQDLFHHARSDAQLAVERYRGILVGTSGAIVLLLTFSFARNAAVLRRGRQNESALMDGQRQAERIVAQLTLLAEMGKLLQSCKEPADVFAVVSQVAVRLVDGSGCLYLMRDARKQLELATTWGNPRGREESFAAEDCLALQHGEPHVSIVGSTLSCRHVRVQPGLATECLPIIAHGEVLGMLCVETGTRRGLSRSDERLALNFACQVGLALANMNLRDTLRNLSVRDPLSGLYNRRHMQESLVREVHVATRKRRPLAIAMVDLDHFKSFNDTFGHDAGDLLLREVAKVLQRFVRGSDVASRYGGEEFVLVCPETSLSTMVERVTQLRGQIKALNLLHLNRPLGTVSASIGIAMYPEHGTTSEALLLAADRALYDAKDSGRDRIALPRSAASLPVQ